MFKINSIDIGATWGIHPQYNGVFNQVLKKPDIKPRYSNDWGELDGIEVDDVPNVVAPNEITLSFIGDTLEGYSQFIDYLIENSICEISIDEISISLNIRYLECSTFSQYNEFNTFSIRVMEDKPRDRVSFYLITQLFDFIVDEQNNKIII